MGDMIMSGKRELMEYVPNYVIYDLETTGFSCNYDKIIEIAAIKVEKGKTVDEFSSLVNPERSIPYGASSVNGITDNMVKDAPGIDEVLPEFIDFIGDDILVGHNIKKFDNHFISRECLNVLGRDFKNDYIDTLLLARLCVPELGEYKLGVVAEHFGISTAGAHRALNDCRMNQQVYECLGKLLSGNKVKIRKCPKCGQMLQKRNGKYGPFWGCSGYPDCRYTENA